MGTSTVTPLDARPSRTEARRGRGRRTWVGEGLSTPINGASRRATRAAGRLSKAPQPLEMYEGRLRGRPKPSDDVELPLRGSGLTNRKRERASRYSDDKPEASPEGAARTLRKARPADRRWLRKALR